jgi:thiol:disulfide interchange protein DsbD
MSSGKQLSINLPHRRRRSQHSISVLSCSAPDAAYDSPVTMHLLTALAAAQNLSDALGSRPLVALATLFGAGVITSLTPCIYPMIPITVGIIGGTAGAQPSRRRTVTLTLTYVVGLATFYAILGVIAGVSGSLFGTIGASPWARLAIGNLLLIFGLVMLDVIPISAPQRLGAWVSRLKGGTLPAVFLLGATSGIVAAPCGAPAFAAVLTWVAGTGSPVLGFVYLFVFSLGMTALLVVVGLSSGALAAMPRSGAWMLWVKKAAGLILLGVAEYYFVQAGMVM